MRRHKKNNRCVQMIVGLSICLLLIMTVGYAAFSTNLNITAKGNIKDTNASWLLKKNIVNTGEGLYKDVYNPESYVYRGVNPNNYITFNNEVWRIISVEKDGSLKIMKSVSIGKMAFDSKGLRDSSSNGVGGTYCANGGNGCNAWMKSDNFINLNVNGSVLKDAELNTYLNGNYYNSLTDDAKKLIISHDFGVGTFTDSYSLSNQFSTENQAVWNGKIGLISLGDFYNSNGEMEQCGNANLYYVNYSACHSTTYLFISNYWTITPYGSNTIMTAPIMGPVNTDSLSNDVNPTVFLKSDISLTGSGTETDPYVIK